MLFFKNTVNPDQLAFDYAILENMDWIKQQVSFNLYPAAVIFNFLTLVHSERLKLECNRVNPCPAEPRFMLF